jgi:hypothetical protein
MQVDCQIFVECDTLVVEYPFCSMYFDRAEMEDKAYNIFGDDFENAVMHDRIENRRFINFAFLDNDDKYDIILDLIYYYKMMPHEIVIVTDKQTKIYK